MSILDVFTPIIGPVIDKMLGMIPNPEERQKQKLAMEAALQAAALQAAQSQLDINKVEAASPSLFVAGWRPAVGWVCVCGLGWQFVALPLLSYLVSVAATIWHFTIPPLPALDNSTLYPLLTSMLGLGALRTYEKTQDVARDTLAK